jgi:hypothetical protein
LLRYAPENYFNLLEHYIFRQIISVKHAPDFIHLFAKYITAFKKGMIKILRHVKKDTSVIIGVSWYKKA